MRQTALISTDTPATDVQIINSPPSTNITYTHSMQQSITWKIVIDMTLLLYSIAGGITTLTFITNLVLATDRAVTIFTGETMVLRFERVGTTTGGNYWPGFL